MKIKWLGHAALLIASDTGMRIVTDPYEQDEMITYGEIKESADIVATSHQHTDHNNASAVGGNPEVVSESVKGKVKGIEFSSIPTYHDDVGGKTSGENTIFCFCQVTLTE